MYEISDEEKRVLSAVRDGVLHSMPDASQIVFAIGEGVRLAIKESIEDGSLKIKIDK